MQGLPPDFRLYRSYRRSLIILRPRCIQHHIKAALLFSRDSVIRIRTADPAKHAVIRRTAIRSVPLYIRVLRPNLQ